MLPEIPATTRSLFGSMNSSGTSKGRSLVIGRLLVTLCRDRRCEAVLCWHSLTRSTSYRSQRRSHCADRQPVFRQQFFTTHLETELHLSGFDIYALTVTEDLSVSRIRTPELARFSGRDSRLVSISKKNRSTRILNFWLCCCDRSLDSVR